MGKINFQTPKIPRNDEGGKSKCHQIHVCPQKIPYLKVHDTKMKLAKEDTYLGDVIRADE